MTKIEKYIFYEIAKGSLLVLFIFLSISWLLQFTRLISLTNLIQVDFFTIFYLSTFLIPNIITVIIPFVIMFGLVITFLKLNKDKEIISIYSLGLKTKSLVKAILYFTFLILLISVTFNFYISPKIYKEYKIKEFEIRNKINFEKIVISNFIEINENTFLDFKKNNQIFEEVFIKFKEEKDNIIYAKEALINQKKDIIEFKLINGFKITKIEDNKIEKLEFENYKLEVKNSDFKEYDIVDQNTFNIFEDINNKNFRNIVHRSSDSFILILIIMFFYYKNIKFCKFNISNIFSYLLFSSVILILNQILKNLEINYLTNSFIVIFFFLFCLFYFRMSNTNVSN